MKVGFVINPIAGMGGTVALKGTDGLIKEALNLGATPVSPIRAELFFSYLSRTVQIETKSEILFLTPSSPMGEQIVSKFSFNYKIINLNIDHRITTPQDTKDAVRLFEQEQVDLIIFVGGDGTSIDIGMSLTKETPILGIPSGVKTYGSVFSHTPEEAASVLLSFNQSKASNNAELLDLDEKLYNKGIISIELKGYVHVPAFPHYFQHAKERVEHNESEEGILEGISEEIYDLITSIKSKKLLIIGPGSTFNPFASKIGIIRSILGIDCIECSEDGKFKTIISDAREDQIFSLLNRYHDVFILVTPIGGMGYIFGRGNHQISPRIVNKVSKNNLLIACSPQKLSTIQEQTLRVDTSNETFNREISGYIRVITNFGESRMVKVIH